jgi:hypothetical protein
MESIEIENDEDNKCDLIINGFDFGFFPFKPHKCQEEIMSTLVQAFDNGKNCIIESPTGTGKCIASLSTCVAYLNKLSTNPNFKKEKDLKSSMSDVLNIFDEVENKFPEITKEVKVEFDKKNKIEIKINLPDEEFINKLNLKSCIDERISLEQKLIGYFKDIMMKNAYQGDSKSNEIFESNKKNFKSKIEEVKKEIKQEYLKFKFPHNVIYAVRTSSQMDVVQDELDRLPKHFTSAFLKSREFHCLNEIIKKNYTGSVLKEQCKAAKNKCDYRKNFIQHNDIKYSTDLKNYKGKVSCAYYGEVRKSRHAALIVCTYNYLLLPLCSQLYRDHMVNPLIIIDEGHNILNACEGFLNFSIKVEDIYECIKELLNINSYYVDIDENPKISESGFIPLEDFSYMVNDVKEKLFDIP